ncbi:hypothetical protein TrLO_g2252 [Triparma laevis f. longispina]|uniref:Myb-like domain-containing protein n=1 Tax=Triparma laevis f. longispina TaxID=1714387 RepID=A0A9W7C8R2_9STRA|nr:hypothetical protein TrLO_g2252 [Triparma laevis f. longispina]
MSSTSSEFSEAEHTTFVTSLSELTQATANTTKGLSTPSSEVFQDIATKLNRPVEEVTTHAYKYFIKLQSCALDLHSSLQNPRLSLNLNKDTASATKKWTEEENTRFENLLTVHNTPEDDRWEKIGAAMNKSSGEVRQMYSSLLSDVFKIECGIK